MKNKFGSSTAIVPLDAQEAEREAALREQFAVFWANATGSPREIFDSFIAATPIAADVETVSIPSATTAVSGWWVRPPNAPKGQAVLYLHGGGYGKGMAKSFRGIASQIAQRVERSLFVLDYPLAPESWLPAAPEAAMRAYRWLVAEGYDKIAIAGDSAGGGLALVTLAQVAKDRSLTQPVAGVALSPWTDLALAGDSFHDPAVVDPLLGRDYLVTCVRQYLHGAEPFDPLASPLYGPKTGLPPLYIQVGADELLLDDARRYAYAASKAGVSVRLEVWEGMHHVFQLAVAQLVSSGVALDRVSAFFRDAFGAA